MTLGNKSKRWTFACWFVSLALVVPVIIMFINGSSANSDTFSHLWDTVLFDYLFNTLSLGVLVTFLSALFGIPSAAIIALTNIRGRRFLRWLLVLPLAMPAYLVAYLYTDLFDYAGPIQIMMRDFFGFNSPQDYWFFDIRSLGGASVIIALVLFPYVYLLTRNAFEQLDANLLKSGRSLGLTQLKALIIIGVPLVRPAIAISLSLVLMETLADFATVQYFAVNTLTTAIYDTWLGYGDLAAANRIASLLLLCVFFVVLWEQYSRRKQKLVSSRANQNNPLINLPPVYHSLALIYCWLLVFFGFLLPMLMLMDMAISYSSIDQVFTLTDSAFNSFIVAAIAATICCLIALLIGLYHRLHASKARAWPQRLSSLGYAVPGTVLAMAILSTFGPLDVGINELAKTLNLSAPGLLFSGTMIAIIFAYVVRFNAIANGAIDSGLTQIAPSLDKVPLSLGASYFRMVKDVHSPLLMRFILGAWLLVFVESMKELPAVLLLRPFNFETLATTIYQLISDEQLEQGALGAILIVLFGLVPVIWLNKQHKGSK